MNTLLQILNAWSTKIPPIHTGLHKKSEQKFKYLKNKKSFYGETKRNFHQFLDDEIRTLSASDIILLSIQTCRFCA